MALLHAQALGPRHQAAVQDPGGAALQGGGGAAGAGLRAARLAAPGAGRHAGRAPQVPRRLPPLLIARGGRGEGLVVRPEYVANFESGAVVYRLLYFSCLWI